MTRLEELTLRLADDDLSPDEQAELDRLIEADAGARQIHVELLEVEFSLRGRKDADVADAVLRRLEGAPGPRLVRGIMERVQTSRPPRWARPRPRSWWAAPLALAASVALVLGWRAVRRPPTPAAPAAVASIAERGGDVIVNGGAPRPDGDTLRPGDRIETRAGATATVRFGRATLRLGPETALSLERAPARPAQSADLLRLHSGALETEVRPDAGPALVIATPHARATVVGTRFRLWVNAASTRLEVTEGHVRFDRLAEGLTTTVAAGETAEAAARSVPAPGAPPIRASEPTTVLSIDFEDAESPYEMNKGQVTDQCPTGVTGRHCAIGSVTQFGLTIHVRKRPHMFFYSPRQVVSFDYWAGRETPRVWVQVRDVSHGRNYQQDLREVVPETWTHVEMRIPDLRPSVAGNGPIEPGDAVGEISVGGTHPVGERLFIDNLSVLEYPSAP
jgi:hypothetical protein